MYLAARRTRTAFNAARRTRTTAGGDAIGTLTVAQHKRDLRRLVKVSSSASRRLHDSPDIPLLDPRPPARKETDCSRRPVLAVKPSGERGD